MMKRITGECGCGPCWDSACHESVLRKGCPSKGIRIEDGRKHGNVFAIDKGCFGSRSGIEKTATIDRNDS